MTYSNPNYISTAELAKFLGISPVAVFKRIQKGQIKAVKIGRSYAIPRSYVEEHFPEYKVSQPVAGEYLSVMEAAQAMGISRVAVFKRIKNGQLEAKRVGRHYVIPKDQIPEVIPKEKLEKDYVSVPELAKAMGISRIAVFKKIQKGMIKAEKVGRHYVIAKETKQTKEDHVSIKELAELLGISRIAVFKKIQKGQIKAVKIGRSYAIPKQEMQRVIQHKNK